MADPVEYNETDGRLYACFEDATGLIQGEGGVSAPDGPYPAMVTWEMGAGSMLEYDARALGQALIALADNADKINDAYFREERQAEARENVRRACRISPIGPVM